MAITSRDQAVEKRSRTTRITELPDHVLSTIISNLDTKDVFRLSATSPELKHLPVCLSKIEFDRTQVCPEQNQKYYKRKHSLCHTMAFTNALNQFLEHYDKMQRRTTTTDLIPLTWFKVCFCLGRHYSVDIDAWVSFAMQKKVKSLDILLDCEDHRKLFSPRPAAATYIFPRCDFGGAPMSLEKLSLRSCIFGRNMTTEWLALKVLELRTAPLTDQDIRNISGYCPNLVKLSLNHCILPAKLVLLPSGSLVTFLELRFCGGVREIKLLDCRTLTVFKYGGYHAKLDLMNNTPHSTTTLTYGVMDYEGLYYAFDELYRDFPSMNLLQLFIKDTIPLSSPSLIHGRMTSLLRLRYLLINFQHRCTFSLPALLEILRACPILEEFHVRPPNELDREHSGVEFPDDDSFRHKFLERVQVSSFCGSWDNIQLLRLLIKVSPKLDLVVVTCDSDNYSCSDSCVPDQYEELWKGHEKPNSMRELLESFLKSGTTLLINEKLSK